MSLVLKSERQIQAQILAKVIAQLGLNDVNPGSVLDILTQAISQQDFALYYQIAQVSRLVDLNALTGTDLDNKAFEYGLSRFLASKTKGRISILRPTGFTKVSTTFYAGSRAPITGDTTIDVNDASSVLYGSSGTLILGRGTNNEEEVPYVIAPVNNTTFWRFTLSAPLTKDHASEEKVILKQGVNQVILAGTTVIVPATGVNSEIQFTIDNDTTLLAGENQVDNVEVTASVAGSAGNIPVGSITGTGAFPTPPFSGAQAYNGTKFTTGRDLETNDELRDRIKNYVRGITKAVKQSIRDAIVGLVDPETAKRVVSAQIVLPIAQAGDVKVYIDDGTGFEPSFKSIGFETILNSATGGEQRLQVHQFPVVKAQIETNTAEPYDMSSGTKTLTVQVGTLQETITFSPSNFASATAGSAEEVIAVINDNSTLIEARTSQVGTNIMISAKRDTNESLQIIGGTANAVLNFPTDKKDTIQLYVDDVLKSKDGVTATLDSGNSAPFNLSSLGGFPQTLTLVVDGKTANIQTATFNTSDAVDTSAVTAAEICAVINRDISGIVATPINSNTKIRLESMTKLSASSKVKVNGGVMNTALGFSTTQSVGADGDYVFNRELGEVQLTFPLVKNQNVTLGSLYTRAKLRAVTPELYAPATGQTLVISIDGGADQTITFDGTFTGGKTAQQTADFINTSLKGGTAIVRLVGGLNYLEINTNTYTSGGSIRIQSTSTGNGPFAFPTNSTKVSGNPNKASKVSGNTGPFNFAEGDSLVTVVDNDIVNNTFAIPMNYGGSITSATSTTVFSDTSLSPIFVNNDEIKDFYIAFKTGANTATGTIVTVSIPVAGTARYTFDVAPGTFGSYGVNDLFKLSGMNNSENNGNFLITAVGANYVEVANPSAIAATSQTGTATLSQRRRILSYNASTGQITTTVAFSNTPSIGNTHIIIPSTVDNLVKYTRNTKVTSFTLKGIVEGVEGNTKLQLSSKSQGSDGYVQVTGGTANRALNFSTVVSRGLQAYSYWTGLLALVHKTIYGDDSNSTSYPGYGAAGITFRVLAPTIRNVLVTLKLTLKEGISVASVENEVKSAVSGYINTLGVGDDVIIERIRSAVIAIPGITDVVVTAPSANITIADNEKAAVRDPDVKIG